MSVFQAAFILLATIVLASTGLAQAKPEPRTPPSSKVLTKEQWKQLDESVERGLEYLATQQQPDGSFRAIDVGQPAVTSFCVMAFLAQGESPVDGQYQQQLTKAIDFIADQQKPNGLIALIAPNAVPIPRDEQSSERLGPRVKPNSVSVTAVYNHAISALALSEAYGQCNATQAKKLAPVIEKAIATTLEMQRWPGRHKTQQGGWRYLTVHHGFDSDLSVTGWQLMFLRSAKDAGFDVPKESIDGAVRYVETCFLKDDDRQVYTYLAGNRSMPTRSMAGAGILAMAHAGKHDSKEAVAAGDWILKHDLSNYDFERKVYKGEWRGDRYHYGAILCTQAMYQLSGKHWEKFFPPLFIAFQKNQQKDGSWLTKGRDKPYGSCYTTSLSILSLSVPNQMLPIFQR